MKTVCKSCHGGCGVLVNWQDTNPISGDIEHPITQGYICSKGIHAGELVNNPTRLRSPLMKVKTEDGHKHIEISWDKAFDVIAEKLKEKTESSSESILFATGTDRNYQEWIFRIANLIGTPNVLGPAHICFYPKIMAQIISMGAFTFCDYDNEPECIILWGSNKPLTNSDGCISNLLRKAINKSCSVYTIGPKKNLAGKSKWISLAPGQDLYLALALIYFVIKNRWYDQVFVEQYCEGFDELKEYIDKYNESYFSQHLDIPISVIIELARNYALSKKAVIEIGTGVEQNTFTFSICRAISILMAICGKLDRPGCNVIYEPTQLDGRRTFPLTHKLSPEQAAKRLGANKHKVLSLSGWCHPNSVWEAMLSGKPYSVDTAIVFGSSLFFTYANCDLIIKSLQQLEFLVVADLFMTPVAKMADIILPVSSWLERDQIVEQYNYISARNKTIELSGVKSDEEIIIELASRLNLSEYFGLTVEQTLDNRLAPLQLTWNMLKDLGTIKIQPTYEKFKIDGFNSKNKKFNIYSNLLLKLGYSPIIQTPSEIEIKDNEFIVTSQHSPYFFNTEFRNIKLLRKHDEEAIAEINIETALDNNLSNGEWVYLCRNNKKSLFKLKFSNHIHPKVIVVSASFYIPEHIDDSNNKWNQSNINLLTDDINSNAEMGSSQLRGILCTLEKKGEYNE